MIPSFIIFFFVVCDFTYANHPELSTKVDDGKIISLLYQGIVAKITLEDICLAKLLSKDCKDLSYIF
jgi:hypothetical protein